jgi:hypothetical protein
MILSTGHRNLKVDFLFCTADEVIPYQHAAGGV